MNTTSDGQSNAPVSRGHGFKPRLSPEIFSGFLRNCINCVHNYKDHSSFDTLYCQLQMAVLLILFMKKQRKLQYAPKVSNYFLLPIQSILLVSINFSRGRFIYSIRLQPSNCLLEFSLFVRLKTMKIPTGNCEGYIPESYPYAINESKLYII